MNRSALCLLAALSLVATASAGTLPEEWQRVQQALTTASTPAIEDSVRDLVETAGEVQAHRLTPYARALCAWAEGHGGEAGWAAVRLAAELDPVLPGPSFLRARWQWRDGELLAATWSYLGGMSKLVAEPESRRLLGVALAGWLLLSLAGALATTVIVQTARYLRETTHDAWELGRSLFHGSNAWVFTAVILLLPIFAGLGPLWLLSWLFLLGWAYLDRFNRVGAVTVTVLLALLGFGFQVWQSVGFLPVDLESRAAAMLEQRQVDLVTLREVADLEPEFEGHGPYQLVLGELLRLHGDIVGAKVAFQRAVVQAPRDPRGYLFLGGMALEDGDIARAAQSYNHVLELDPRSAIAYRNLSYAYDQSYRFQAADSARNKAEELVRQGLDERALPGRAPRVSFPRLGGAEVSAALANATTPPVTGGRALAASLSALRRPGALVFLSTVVLGLLVLALRSRYSWLSSSCIRCGRLFCRRCKSAMESESYCSQCISVFLKRDVVSIEQQSAKLSQIRRWELVAGTGRRLVTAVLPGSGPIVRGRIWIGLATTGLAWFLALGVVVVVPSYLTSVEPQASWLPLEVLLALAFLGVWVLSITGNWRRR